MSVLITMRLSDMQRVHPEQITGRCVECGHEVGIYPSGQRALKTHPGMKVVCQVCRPPRKLSALAPGARLELLQSVKKK